ncbi:Uncharacterised protein [Metamycoplasma cloacale]|uniref:Uncharacterized protein n=1 Tax=Metamycoplasma cloacale TaxID=92401 RepID=A0A2Z4LM16_9BACT|nr:FIVAR domain-containing protein [Metamycoplasma cloacale]AWX42779.1 hypothetical protein DK849_01730 [Metamycoplasma cloacale]VEU79405.1 Uncharacterised protein [Metamycoplasma cloacale]
MRKSKKIALILLGLGAIGATAGTVYVLLNSKKSKNEAIAKLINTIDTYRKNNLNGDAWTKLDNQAIELIKDLNSFIDSKNEIEVNKAIEENSEKFAMIQELFKYFTLANEVNGYLNIISNDNKYQEIASELKNVLDKQNGIVKNTENKIDVINSFNTLKNAYENAISKINDNNLLIASKINELDDLIKQANEYNESVKNTEIKEELKRAIEIAVTKKDATNATTESLTNAYNNLELILENIKVKNEEWKMAHTRLESKISEIELNKGSYGFNESELNDLSLATQEAKNIANDYSNDKTALDNAIVVLENKVKEIKERADLRKQEELLVKNKLNSLINQVAEFKNDVVINTQIKERLNQNITNASSELNNNNATSDTLNEAYNKLKEQFDIEKSNHNEWEKSYNNLKNKIDETEIYSILNSSSSNDLTNLFSAIEESKTILDNRNSNKTTLDNQLAKLEKAYIKAKELIDLNKTQEELAKEKLQILISQSITYKNSIINQNIKEELNNQIQNAQNALSNPSATLDSLNNAYTALEEALNSAKSQNTDWKDANASLNDKINEINNLKNSDAFNSSEIQEIDNAITEAQKSLDNPNIDKDAINNAKTTLENQFKAIQEKADARKAQEQLDKQKLATLITEANEYNNSIKNTTINSELSSAIQIAINKKDAVNATSESLTEALNELQTALDNVKIKNQEWNTSYTNLDDKIKEIEANRETDEVNESELNTLNNAIKEAKAVLNDPNSDKTALDNAKTTLENKYNEIKLAFNSRKENENKAKEKLNNLINQANSAKESIINTAIKDVLSNAIQNAEAASNNPKATTDSLNNAYTALEATLNEAKTQDTNWKNANSALNDKINEINSSKNSNNFNSTELQQINEAIVKATESLNNSSLAQEALESAKTELENKYNEIKKNLDNRKEREKENAKQKLNALINQATEEKNKIVNNVIKNELGTAIQTAKNVLDSSDSSTEDLNKAYQTLESALNNSKEQDNDWKNANSNLNTKINEINSSKDGNNFNSTELKQINDAIAKATESLNNPLVNKQELENAKTTLENAYKKVQTNAELRKQQENKEKEKLETLIKESSLYKDSITNSFIKDELSSSIQSAINKKDDANATIDSLTQTYKDLESALQTAKTKNEEWKTAHTNLDNKIKEIEGNKTSNDFNEHELSDLNNAIEAAKTVLSNPSSDKNALDNAKTTLDAKYNEIIQTSELRKQQEKDNAKNQLKSLIDDATSFKDSIINTEIKNKLSQAIQNVQSILDNLESSTEALDNAYKTLETIFNQIKLEDSAWKSANSDLDNKINEINNLKISNGFNETEMLEINTIISEAKKLLNNPSINKENLEIAKSTLETEFRKIQAKAELRKQQENLAKEKLQTLINQANTYNQTTVENTTIKNELQSLITTATTKKDAKNATAESLEQAYNELNSSFDAVKTKQNTWKASYDGLKNRTVEVNNQIDSYNLDNIEKQQLLAVVNDSNEILNNKNNDAQTFNDKLQKLNNAVNEYKTKNDVRNQIKTLLTKLDQDKNNEYIIDKQELQSKITKFVSETNTLLNKSNSTLLEFQTKKTELENLIKETNDNAVKLKTELRSKIETTLSNTKDSLTLSLLQTYQTRFNFETSLNERMSKLQPVFDNVDSNRKSLEDALSDYNTIYDKAKIWFELLEKFAFMKKTASTDREHLELMGKLTEFESKISQIERYIQIFSTEVVADGVETRWKNAIKTIDTWLLQYGLNFNEEKSKQTYTEWIKILNKYS